MSMMASWRVSPSLVAGGALLLVFLMYRSALEVPCGSESWRAEKSGATSEPSVLVKPADIILSKAPSVSEFLRQKTQKGVFDDLENEDLAELDLSTKMLLSQVVVDAVEHPTLDYAVEHDGLFNLNYGVHSVVRRIAVCSAHRTSLEKFSLITLSPEFTIYTSNPDFKGMGARDPSIFPTCTWLEDGSAGAPLFRSVEAMRLTRRVSVHDGKATFHWMNEVHGTFYDTLMIHCTFPNPVGSEKGGYLYLNISHGLIGTGAPSELVPVYRERANQLDAAVFEASSFQYAYAFCSAPSFTSLVPAHVKQFLMYHYELFERKIHFFLYYSALLEGETMRVLQPLIDGGIVSLVDFSRESNYHIMYHGQAPAINDCLYRTKFLARWSLFWDLDEYLFFPSKSGYTIEKMFEEHKDAPWISFGKVDFRFTHCSPNKTLNHDWAVERMVYRLERPFCFDTCAADRCGEMCKAEKGMRKWIANPRKVRSAVTHSISDPRDLPDGVALHTDIARLNHYRGLVAPRARINCQEIRDSATVSSTTDSDGKTNLIMDDELASLVTSLKKKVESIEVFGGSN